MTNGDAAMCAYSSSEYRQFLMLPAVKRSLRPYLLRLKIGLFTTAMLDIVASAHSPTLHERIIQKNQGGARRPIVVHKIRFLHLPPALRPPPPPLVDYLFTSDFNTCIFPSLTSDEIHLATRRRTASIILE